MNYSYLHKLFFFPSYSYVSFGVVRFNNCHIRSNISSDIKRGMMFDHLVVNFTSGEIIFPNTAVMKLEVAFSALE